MPVRNEASRLPALLGALREAGVFEVIVVDGESVDGSADVARCCGATVKVCPPGRGRQLRSGAEVATGDLLIFLHADTMLPPDFADHAARTLRQTGVSAGAFELEIDAEGWAYRLIERLVRLRSRWWGLPYGDQAIFVTRSTYDAVGGFSPIPAMEDYDLVRRLRRRGRIVVAPVAVRTSARRWQRDGVGYTTLLNLVCLLATFAGVSPHRIARWRDDSTAPRA